MEIRGINCVIFVVAALGCLGGTEAFPSISGALSSLINGESTVTDLQRLSSLPKKPSTDKDQNLVGQSSNGLESISDVAGIAAASSSMPGKRRLDDTGDLALSASKLSRKHQAEQQQLLRQYTELMKAQLMSQQSDESSDFDQQPRSGQANRRSGQSRRNHRNQARQQVQAGPASQAAGSSKRRIQGQRSNNNKLSTKRSDYRAARSGLGVEADESRKSGEQSLGGNVEANELERDPVFRDDDDEHSDRRNSDDDDAETAGPDDDDQRDSDEDGQSRSSARAKASRQRKQIAGGRAGSKQSAESRRPSADGDSDDGGDGGESSASDESEPSDEDSDSSELKPSAAPLANRFNNRHQPAAAPDRDGSLDNSETVSQVSNVKLGRNDLQAAAAGHHGHHGHYYQHVEVPKKKAWKFGFKRGNHKHESKLSAQVSWTKQV